MTHHHEGHHHNHDDQPEEMGFSEKMEKLLAHWIHHNDDHLSNYKKWAQTAREEDRKDLSEKLEEAADLTGQITKVFQTAKNSLK